MKLAIVTIGRQPIPPPIEPIPYYCLAEESAYNRYRDVYDETVYLAEKRNRAISGALEKFPETTDIVSVDSYYVVQVEALRRLIYTYQRIGGGVILGAPIWYYRKNRLIDNRPKFYDSWGSPELVNVRPWDPEKWPEIIQVPSVGNCVIFPVDIWRKHSLVTPEPFPYMGSCYTRLCNLSGLPVLIDTKAKMYRTAVNNREAVYPFMKRFRVSVGALLRPMRERTLGGADRKAAAKRKELSASKSASESC